MSGKNVRTLGGEGGIRTLDTVKPYTGFRVPYATLARWRLPSAPLAQNVTVGACSGRSVRTLGAALLNPR